MSRARQSVLSVCIAAAIASTLHAQDVIWERGEANGVFFGVALAVTPDVDGDGLDDVIAGDYQHSGGSGGAFVYSGATGETVRSWIGPPGLNGLGNAVAGLGDVDGDGLGDVAVSAYWQNGAPGIYVGRVFAYSGATGAEIWSRSGEGSQDYFGERLRHLADLTGDGKRELAVSSSYHDGPAGTDSGRVYVLDGASGSLLWSADGETAGDRFGEGLGSTQDIDADGLDDVLVGAPRYGNLRGKVYAFSGASGALLFTAEGLSSGDLFGTALAGVGDVLSNPGNEILVGSPGFDGAAGADCGRVVLLDGSNAATQWSLEGMQPGILLGERLAAAGDMNRDGKGDFVVGAGHSPSTGGPGEAWLLSGRTLARLWRWQGRQDRDRFGTAIDTGGDLDGDGFPDVVVGAYQDNTGPGRGRVVAFHGNDLFLDANPAQVGAGGTIRFHTRGGPGKAKAILYLVEIGGIPVHFPIAKGRLDQRGEWMRDVKIPAELGNGTEVRFQTIAERGSYIADSNATSVNLH